MHYETKLFPKQIHHFVTLTNEDLNLAVKEAIRKEHPQVVNLPHIRLVKDVFGMWRVDVSWVENV